MTESRREERTSAGCSVEIREVIHSLIPSRTEEVEVCSQLKSVSEMVSFEVEEEVEVRNGL